MRMRSARSAGTRYLVLQSPYNFESRFRLEVPGTQVGNLLERNVTRYSVPVDRGQY